MAFQELILDRYRILGRAGAGGYATVQHAYDTHLKRDVAIKCIKINPLDLGLPPAAPVAGMAAGRAGVVGGAAAPVAPAASAAPATPVLNGIAPDFARGAGADEDAKSGFVPLSDKVAEPSFLSKREKMAEKRARRRRLGFLKPEQTPGAQDFTAAATAPVLGAGQGYGQGGLRPGQPGRAGGAAAASQEEYHAIDNEIQIPDFIAAKLGGPSRGAGSSKPKGRIDPYAVQAARMHEGQAIAAGPSGSGTRSGTEAHTVDIMRLAGELPGKISGVGETSIASIDDSAVGIDAALLHEGEQDEAADEDRDLPWDAEDEEGLDEEDAKTTAFEVISADPNMVPLENLLPFANFVKTKTFSGSHCGDTEDFPDNASSGTASDGASGGNSAASSQESSQAQGAQTAVIPLVSPQALTRPTPHGAQPAAPAAPRSIQDLASVNNIPGLEEARTAAHLNDANIVTVYDCVIAGDTAYVIMEYVEGKTLARIMRDIGNDITLDMIASVFSSVSHALEVAHKANVLHLDIKPENVIVNSEGVVKVTDFGLSTLMDAGGSGTTGGGTIGYMPLEQMRQQPLDVRTDEWALASLTYEMLSGKNPFKARSLADAEQAILGAELVIPSLCWEDIDSSVDDIMFDALSPDMDGRYETIEEFAEDLNPILGDPKAGRVQLAAAVNDELPEVEEEVVAKRPKAPSVPLIDRLGPRGAGIAMRVFAALGALMIGAISCLNFRMVFGPAGASSVSSFSADGSLAANYTAGADTMFGLFSTMPIAAGIVLVVLAALSAFRPRVGFPFAYATFAIMLLFNQAWACGLCVLAAAGAWWWFFGRHSDEMCTLVVLQPLFGSVGFAAVVPVLAGALLDVRDALLTTLMVAVSALGFASLGSDNVMNWEVYSNFIVAVNPAIAGAFIADSLLVVLQSPMTWCELVSWVCGAALFSLFCRRGTKVFDVIGSVACAACLIAGVLLLPLSALASVVLTPLTVAGAVVPACLAVILAVANVTDRVRMAEGEW